MESVFATPAVSALGRDGLRNVIALAAWALGEVMLNS